VVGKGKKVAWRMAGQQGAGVLAVVVKASMVQCGLGNGWYGTQRSGIIARTKGIEKKNGAFVKETINGMRWHARRRPACTEGGRRLGNRRRSAVLQACKNPEQPQVGARCGRCCGQ